MVCLLGIHSRPTRRASSPLPGTASRPTSSFTAPTNPSGPASPIQDMDTGQDTTDKDATDKDTTDKDTKGKDIKGTGDTMDTDKEYKDKFMAAVAQLQQDHEIGRADVVPLVESMKLMPEATARYSELIERIMVLQLAAVRLDNQRDGSQLH